MDGSLGLRQLRRAWIHWGAHVVRTSPAIRRACHPGSAERRGEDGRDGRRAARDDAGPQHRVPCQLTLLMDYKLGPSSSRRSSARWSSPSASSCRSSRAAGPRGDWCGFSLPGQNATTAAASPPRLFPSKRRPRLPGRRRHGGYAAVTVTPSLLPRRRVSYVQEMALDNSKLLWIRVHTVPVPQAPECPKVAY